LHADQVARIGARVGGYLVELRADLGSRVKQGDLLARIDVPELDQQRTAIEASLGETEARQTAAAATTAADASEFRRTSELARSGAVTPQVRDEAEQRARASAAGLAAAEATLKTAHAKLAEIETMIRYASLRAPFDGVVIARDGELGDLIAAGRPTPLLTVAKVDVMRFRFAVPERIATAIKPGAPACVRITALADTAITGKISRVAGALDPATRTMTAEIELANPDGKLLPGLAGRVELGAVPVR
jgi:RND family efflux transporter MFP subunit